MNSSSDREEALFAEALARPVGERAAFLAQICGGDHTLRNRLTALLAAHEAPESALAPLTIPTGLSPEEQTGDRIGRYKLLQKLGEGGCGVVYMADQQEPVHRRVALKVIKLGMDTREVIARFEGERQALALMDHPNIAKVFDAGATANGRPFFVMELVRGVRITDYCDDHSISTGERLGLFIQVCHAVQHAHQKGIIHRDLKPSNILVTVNDGVAVPKIIDFGIAKATQGRLTDSTVFTAFEQFIGTPAYMSPEQALMTSLDIDTRSDIYSLGVLLYELLTGRTPFDAKELVQAGLDEIRRRIREVEPPKPSARLSTMEGDTLTLTAQHRQTEPPKLINLVRGDLDWIVMKALEKDRARRYETATAFAADLARHRQHEPVAARPPSAVYRAGKFIRRHRLGLAAVASVVFALLLGTAVSLQQAVRARRAEHRASVERSKAEAERTRFEGVFISLFGELRQQLERLGRLDILDAGSARFLEYFAAADPGNLSDASLANHAKALTQSGGLRVDQARYADAERDYAAAYSRAVEIAQRHPRNGEMLYVRGQVEFGIGLVHYRRGELDPARTWFVRYRDTAAALVALDPTNLTWQREVASGHHNLAAVDRDEGKLEASRESFLSELVTLNRLLEAKPADLELKAQVADVVSYLGSLAERTGNLAEAVGRYGEQVACFEALRSVEPEKFHWRFKQAESLGLQAGVLAVRGQLPAARQALAQACGLLEALVAHDGGNQRWRAVLLVMKLKEAVQVRAEGDLAQALPGIEVVRKSLGDFVVSEPADQKSKCRLAMAWRVVAEVRHALKRDDAGLAAGQAVELGEKLVGAGRPCSDEAGELARACVIAGQIDSARGDAEAALRHWQRAREVLAPFVAKTKDWRILDPAVRVATLLGRSEEAQARISLLTQLGFVPLEPWPNPDSLGATQSGFGRPQIGNPPP
jgi:tetratricopeptide (TPR) repeat protein